MSKTIIMSQGAKFRAAITNNDPLQIVGTINAYSAMMAEKVGHQAIYLSGGRSEERFSRNAETVQ